MLSMAGLKSFFNVKTLMIITLISLGGMLMYQNYQIDDLKQEKEKIGKKVTQLENEVSLKDSLVEEQKSNNDDLNIKIDGLTKAYEEQTAKKDLHESELVDIREKNDKVKNELANLKLKLTDNILLSKPMMLQKRIRSASMRAYNELQEETTNV